MEKKHLPHLRRETGPEIYIFIYSMLLLTVSGTLCLIPFAIISLLSGSMGLPEAVGYIFIASILTVTVLWYFILDFKYIQSQNYDYSNTQKFKIAEKELRQGIGYRRSSRIFYAILGNPTNKTIEPVVYNETGQGYFVSPDEFRKLGVGDEIELKHDGFYRTKDVRVLKRSSNTTQMSEADFTRLKVQTGQEYLKNSLAGILLTIIIFSLTICFALAYFTMFHLA